MKIRVYRVTQDGGKELEEEMRVFPTHLGNHSLTDQVSEFLSYPSLSRNTHPQAQVFLLWSTVPQAWLQVR
ncbi:Uncharacterised protein [Salmonella enterica subsp. enterica serovar Oranienburg]|nr:Uncharacterised protein [Salmonella enterica subsp. enterica serovar Oranienburg]